MPLDIGTIVTRIDPQTELFTCEGTKPCVGRIFSIRPNVELCVSVKYWQQCSAHADMWEAEYHTVAELWEIGTIPTQLIGYQDISGYRACGAQMWQGLEPAICGRAPGHETPRVPHLPASFHCEAHRLVFASWAEVEAHGAETTHRMPV